MEKFTGQSVLILGMGLSGRSAAEFLLMHGASVFGVDRDGDLLSKHFEIQSLKNIGLQVCCESDFQDVSRFNFIILSPGLPLSHPLVKSAEQLNIPIVGEIELGCQTANNPMIGITGTNGKTTVALLVTHVLSHCGFSAETMGNVGVPLTRELLNIDKQTTIVLELSSYQIETLYHPCLVAAIILNITPDHLDRYHSMEVYAQAKCGLERALKPEGHLYIEENASKQYGYLLRNKHPRIYGYAETCFIHTDLQSVFREGKKVFELPLVLKNKKSHDLENLLAAYALCSDRGVSGQAFCDAWALFKKPPHRIEFVREVGGVSYYDDSKGTNIDAVIRAVQTFQGPIILIAGGVEKGSPYTPWLEEFKDKVKLICAIGQAAGNIEAQLAVKFPVMIFCTLDEAVHQAACIAQKGDTVLLSPGCSSFDMFKDYAHRGNEFQRIVCELEETK